MVYWLDQLPNEVLFCIFPHIPMLDLIQSCSLVNQRWYNIIMESKFLYHRKRYYRYKLNHQQTMEELQTLISPIQGPKDCIPWLLAHIHKQTDLHVNTRLRLNLNNSQVLFSAISGHSRYPLALALLMERFPELSTPVSYPAIVAVICLTARNVDDIREIFKLAVSHSSPCVSLEITELIYQVFIVFKV